MAIKSWAREFVAEKATIVPSLLAANFANLESDIRRLEQAGVKVLHFDVMDGVFVPNISFGLPVLASIRKITTLKLDVHLMIVQPERYVDAFRKSGADSITFHVEASSDPKTLLKRIRELGAAPGLALNYGTSVEKILPFVDDADILLTMSVPAGFGGQKFRSDVLDAIRAIRAKAGDEKLFEIDGGIDVDTISLAGAAGVNFFVAGTGVFRAQDYGAQVALLREKALGN